MDRNSVKENIQKNIQSEAKRGKKVNADHIKKILHMVMACSRSIIRARDLFELLNSACRSIVREGGYAIAWIGFYDPSIQKKVIPKAQYGLKKRDTKNFFETPEKILHDVSKIDSKLSQEIPFILKYARDKKALRKWAPRSKHYSYNSLILLRLSAQKEKLGVLAIYAMTDEEFSSKEIKVLQELATDISLGIVSIRNKEQLTKAQIELQESQQMLQLVMDTIPVRLFWKDKNFKYLGCNLAFAADAGLESPDQIVGKNDFELSWKESAPLYRADDMEIIQKNISKVNYEEPQVREDGTSSWLRTTKIPLQSNQGEIIGLFGSYEDITEKKRAEEALKESERRYKMATNAGRVGVWDLEIVSGEMYIDPILKVLLGYDDHEIDNQLKSWENLIHPEDRARVKEIKSAYIQGMISNFELQYRMIHREGNFKWFGVRGTVLTDKNNKPFRMVGTNTDVTTQIEMEQEQENMRTQLLQAQKMEAVGTLAGGMAHDFNNLLTTIKGYADISISGLKEDEVLYRNCKQIQKAVKRASTLTNQLLLFSRKQLPEPASININETIKNMLILLDRVISEDVHIQTELHQEIWKIWADEGNFEQVIMNLAVNSRDAMPQGGIIHIKTENVILREKDCTAIPKSRPGQFVHLIFSDNGMGMRKDVLRHIFEPFFTTKEMGKGTGLGLSVIYGIITQHQGWINVSSTERKGTTFELYIPASFAKPSEELDTPVTQSDLQGNGELILLVEDEEGIREFVIGLLEDHNYRVLAATDFNEAVQYFKKYKNKIDLIFTDVILPDRSGIELADELLKDNPKIGIILTSGYAGDKTNWELIQSKGFRFLKKPFAVSELLYDIYRELKK
jgi:PAS domain S-box-containing protein